MTIVEKIANMKWNYKFYGNYVYLDGVKTRLKDEQKSELIAYRRQLIGIDKMLESITVTSNDRFSNKYHAPTGTSSTVGWLINVKESDNDNIVIYLFTNTVNKRSVLIDKWVEKGSATLLEKLRK
jgi:hypothetical protein